jgi:AraC-like DNA-binding protein
MAEVLFAFDENNYGDCQRIFRGERDREYYRGNLMIDDAAIIDVRAERRAVGPASIIRLRSRTPHRFRRSWSHIREDATDVTVLWFVRRGSLVVTTPNGSSLAGAGDFAVTRSMTPFFVDCQTDEATVHETLHVTVPTHALRGRISDGVATGFSTPAGSRGFGVAENILDTLLEDEGDLAPDTAEILLESALAVIGHEIRGQDVGGGLRETIAERRLQEALRFIEVHLSNPNLSITLAARGCGISPRYLSFLLRRRNTTFSTLVWEQRLRKARAWLSSSSPGQVSIGEIAYSVGFKSPAHFSRMFKRTYEMNPRDFRANSDREERPGSARLVEAHADVDRDDAVRLVELIDRD